MMLLMKLLVFVILYNNLCINLENIVGVVINLNGMIWDWKSL